MDEHERRARHEELYEQWIAMSIEYENAEIALKLLKELLKQKPELVTRETQFVEVLKFIAHDQSIIAAREQKAKGRKKKELAIMRKNYEEWGAFFKNHPFIISCMSVGEVIDALTAHARTLKERVAMLERAAKET